MELHRAVTDREHLDQERLRLGLDALPDADDREVACRTLRAIGVDTTRACGLRDMRVIEALPLAELLARALWVASREDRPRAAPHESP